MGVLTNLRFELYNSYIHNLFVNFYSTYAILIRRLLIYSTLI